MIRNINSQGFRNIPEAAMGENIRKVAYTGIAGGIGRTKQFPIG
jgi:hypothetical protein